MKQSITVETNDLRAALLAVSPHAGADPQWTRVHRIRFTVVAEHLLTVTATNGFTCGHAVVSVWDPHLDPHTEGPVVFDLSPADVKKILVVHPKVKLGGGDDVDGQATLRIDIRDYDDHREVVFTDSSGLWDGQHVGCVPVPDEDYPDVPALISATARKAGAEPDRLVADGTWVGLFCQAARAYGQPLSIEATAAPTRLLISCGESFLGVLIPTRRDEDDDTRFEGWRRAWLGRLPDPVGAPADLLYLDEQDTLSEAGDALGDDVPQPGPGQIDITGGTAPGTVTFLHAGASGRLSRVDTATGELGDDSPTA